MSRRVAVRGYTNCPRTFNYVHPIHKIEQSGIKKYQMDFVILTRGMLQDFRKAHYLYSFYLKKVATTACFIREESSGGSSRMKQAVVATFLR